MIFQYQDEDSGEPVQMNRVARALEKKRVVIVFGCYFMGLDNIAAAVLRHAEFS